MTEQTKSEGTGAQQAAPAGTESSKQYEESGARSIAPSGFSSARSSVWQSFKMDKSIATDSVFPLGEHYGDAMDVLWELYCAGNINILQLAVDCYVTYTCINPEFNVLLLKLAKDEVKWADVEDLFLKSKWPMFFKTMYQIKAISAKFQNALTQYIGKPKAYEHGRVFEQYWTRLVGKIAKMMSHSYEIKGLPRKINYYYKVAGNSKTGNIKLPNNIEVDINETSHVRMNIHGPLQPYFHTNSGLSLKTLLFRLFCIALKIPGGFAGMRDHYKTLTLYESLKLSSTGSAGSDFLEMLTKWLKIMAMGEQNILLSPEASNDDIADCLVYKFLVCAFFEAVNNSNWQDGITDTGPKLEAKYWRVQHKWRINYDPGALVTLTEHLNSILERLGFPVSGSGSWNVYAELGQTVDCMKYCGCDHDDMDDITTKSTFH